MRKGLEGCLRAVSVFASNEEKDDDVENDGDVVGQHTQIGMLGSILGVLDGSEKSRREDGGGERGGVF